MVSERVDILRPVTVERLERLGGGAVHFGAIGRSLLPDERFPHALMHKRILVGPQRLDQVGAMAFPNRLVDVDTDDRSYQVDVEPIADNGSRAEHGSCWPGQRLEASQYELQHVRR